MSTFLLDAPMEDINVLLLGLAKLVNDPAKLKITGKMDKGEERAENLALSLFELLNRRYRSEHAHTWHCLIGFPELSNQTIDTAAALVLNVYGSECADGEVDDGGSDPPDEPHARKPMLPSGTMIIDT